MHDLTHTNTSLLVTTIPLPHQPAVNHVTISPAAHSPQVNLGALNMNTLKRYKRHYGLKDETPTKRDLVELVTDHFRAQEMSVSEQETILLFR